jgi:type III pantothenate kinase
MLLAALDQGNSRLHAALFAPTATGVVFVERRDSPDFRRWRVPVAEVVYSSVHPESDRKLERSVLAGWGLRARRMGREFPAAIRNRTRKPGQTGADRLANAVAAWRRCRRACAVFDLGTAITVDVVNKRGEFIGGLIAPGLAAMARSLHHDTSLLPLVRPRPRYQLGRDTKSAIEAGLYGALMGAIGLGVAMAGLKARLFGTGGDAHVVAPMFDEVVPHLTLEGIALSWLHAQRRLR